MVNTIRIKRRAAGGAAGPPAGLANAELAFNEQDNTLYYGKGGTPAAAASVIAVVTAGAGGGNVSNSGTPVNGQLAQWIDATHIQGINTSILNIPAPSTTTPAMDGTAAVGTGTTYARNDHIHPTDTSRASTAIFTSTVNGLAPSSGGGTVNYLRADGTWATPPGGGGGIPDAPSSITDDFNRANGGLGANWTDSSDLAVSQGGSLQISGNQVVSSPTNINFVSFYSGAPFPNDQYAQATIIGGITGYSTAGVVVRHQGSGRSSFYVFIGYPLTTPAQVAYFRCDNGTWTALASNNAPVNSGSILKLRVVGSTLTGSVDGVDQPSVTDTTYASGFPGIHCRSGAADNFQAGSIIYGRSNNAWVNLAASFQPLLTPAALTAVNDTNVTLTLGGTPATALLQATSVTVGWTGTLAATRLNANVVQAVVNDTNVTGSIASQVLTLGWTGLLAAARFPALTGDVTTAGGALATTLATVNSNIGTFQGITVNAKGLVTAAVAQGYLTANQIVTLSGDVTGSGATAITATIAPNAVTNAKLATAPPNSFKANPSASTGNVGDISGTVATAMLNVFSSTLQGLVPASGGGTTNYLRADGTFAAPPGGAAPALPTQQIFLSGSGTYTTPTSPVCRRLEVTLVGGGASGCSGVAGTAGGNTTFGSATAGGGGASPNNYTAGTPGTASGGTQNITGGWGTDGGTLVGGVNCAGSPGGATIFGGAGGGGQVRGGTNAAANTGAGGGGGYASTAATTNPGAGGSSGGAVKWWINSPSATYSYSVGAGGTGPAAALNVGAGGNGAAGVIIVREFY